MQLVKTLSLGLLATVLWNCNSSTQLDASAQKDSRLPATINALTKIAAVNAGYTVQNTSVQGEGEGEGLPFDTEALAKLKEAGICQGFIDLFAEISENKAAIEAGTFSPRLQQVITCFAGKAQALADTANAEANFSLAVEDCFCNGSGSLFGGFTVNFSKYSAPKLGSTYAAPSTGSTYSAPTISGSVYSAPKGASAEAYSAPSL